MHAVEKEEKILTNSKVVFYMHLQLIKDNIHSVVICYIGAEQCHDSVGAVTVVKNNKNRHCNNGRNSDEAPMTRIKINARRIFSLLIPFSFSLLFTLNKRLLRKTCNCGSEE